MPEFKSLISSNDWSLSMHQNLYVNTDKLLSFYWGVMLTPQESQERCLVTTEMEQVKASRISVSLTQHQVPQRTWTVASTSLGFLARYIWGWGGHCEASSFKVYP